MNNTTWIGNIYGAFPISGTTVPVVVSDTGQLAAVPSSERYKKDIRSLQKASEAILSLRPVSFHYKTDARNIPQFGLIAEEVAKINPALVVLDKDGEPYSVRYEAVNAMLLNEFLKEHKKVRQLEIAVAQLRHDFEAMIAELKKEIADVVARSKDQNEQIAVVRTDVELKNAAAGRVAKK